MAHNAVLPIKGVAGALASVQPFLVLSQDPVLHAAHVKVDVEIAYGSIRESDVRWQRECVPPGRPGKDVVASPLLDRIGVDPERQIVGGTFNPSRVGVSERQTL